MSQLSVHYRDGRKKLLGEDAMLLVRIEVCHQAVRLQNKPMLLDGFIFGKAKLG